jgi:general secretion pathway protein N
MGAPQPLATMSDQRWPLVGLVLGVLMGVTVFAPASWMAAMLGQVTGSRLQLSQPRGTLWRGDAQLVLSGGKASREALVLPGRVSWRLRPQWTGLVLRLAADCCTTEPLLLSARLRWGAWSLALADNRSQWPAQVLAGLGAPWNTLQPQGRMVISSKGLSVEWLDRGLGAVVPSVDAQADWQLPVAPERQWFVVPAPTAARNAAGQSEAVRSRSVEWRTLEFSG